MSTSNLDRTLGEVLSEIRAGLADKIRKATNEEIDIIRKAKGFHKLIEKKDKISKTISETKEKHYKHIRELENQEKQMELEIENLDKISDEELDFDSKTVYDLIRSYGRATISEFQAAKKMSKSTEAKNYFNFLNIERNTQTMYNLAVSAKEKRNMILSIQSRDWRSIGIDIPQLPHFEKFQIEDGQIIVPTRPLIEAGK
jgi:hypothetical protein